MQNLNRLSKDEQLALRKEILKTNPEWIEPWWFEFDCDYNVLIVTDGILNFGIGELGLSVFLTIFKQMETEVNSNLKYKVTLAYRGDIDDASMQVGNPDFVRTIKNFKFDNPDHFDTDEFDELWLFGHSSESIEKAEINAIESFMVKGGGVFATGDHGNIGSGMSAQLNRIKDMRHWENFGMGEVSMNGNRRNDTNSPHPGNVSSYFIDDQKDEFPQKISARLYGGLPNVYPHPLLSIKRTILPTGIIDILPDHPHEEECKAQTTFNVKNPKTGIIHKINTENIAISRVPAGNTADYKSPTQPHCFPAIQVFDGRIANVGRIVVDSTWHHFVNVNLEGFTPDTMEIIFQYYKNITRWIAKKRRRLCYYTHYIVTAMLSERILEASILDMNMKAEDIPDEDLYVIGMHVIDFIEKAATPAEALEFCTRMLENVSPELAEKINVWHPERSRKEDSLQNQFINYEPMVAIGIGMGMAQVKDAIGNPLKRLTKKDEEIIHNAFENGVAEGLKKSMRLFEKNIRSMRSVQKRNR